MSEQFGVSRFQFGEGFVNLMRQAYWYENRQEWVNDCLDCLEGITEQQKTALLNGVATLSPSPSGEVNYVVKNDTKFQYNLMKHRKWMKEECYTFAGKHINKSTVDNYVKQLRAIYQTASINPNFFVEMQRIMKLRMNIADGWLNSILDSASIKKRAGKTYEQFMTDLGLLVFNHYTQRHLEQINEMNRPKVTTMIEDMETGQWMNWGRYSWEMSWEERMEKANLPDPTNVTDVDEKNLTIWQMKVPKVKHQSGIHYETPTNRKQWSQSLHVTLLTNFNNLTTDIVQKILDESITYFEAYNQPELVKWLKLLKVDVLNDTTFTHESFGSEVIQLDSLRGIFHDETANPIECPHSSSTRKKIIEKIKEEQI